MTETKSMTIDGYEVRCTQHPARRATRLLAKIGRVVGPAITNAQAAGVSMESNIAALGPALSALFAELDDQAADTLLCEILSNSSITMPNDSGQMVSFDLSKPEMIDLAFSGKLGTMMSCAKFALEVNFGSFFAAAARIVAQGKAS